MPTTFNVISLGNHADMDTSEGNNIAEGASNLVGLTFGGRLNALAANIQQFSPGSTGYGGGTSTSYDQDNSPSETFRLDGGAEQVFDSSAIYNATITYIDGTTANITAVVFQDTSGNTYLAPEFSANTDQTLLEAAPIRSMTLDSLNSNDFGGMTGTRQAGNFATCFTPSTQITTIHGNRPVETLSVGDRVLTQDHGAQAIRWIGKAEALAKGAKRPIRISAGALGKGLPQQDLVVSQQHRMLVTSKIVQRMMGVPEVFVAAKDLLGLDGVARDDRLEKVTYYHLLFDHHEVIFAQGAPTESMLTGGQALYAIGPASVLELMTLFPKLIDRASLPARIIVKGAKMRRLMARHVQNNMPLQAA